MTEVRCAGCRRYLKAWLSFSPNQLECGADAMCNRCVRRGWHPRYTAELLCSRCCSFVAFTDFHPHQLDRLESAVCDECMDEEEEERYSNDYHDEYSDHHTDHHHNDEYDNEYTDYDSEYDSNEYPRLDDGRSRTKLCFGCGIDKYLTEFSYAQVHKFGSVGRCVDCVNEGIFPGVSNGFKKCKACQRKIAIFHFSTNQLLKASDGRCRRCVDSGIRGADHFARNLEYERCAACVGYVRTSSFSSNQLCFRGPNKRCDEVSFLSPFRFSFNTFFSSRFIDIIGELKCANFVGVCYVYVCYC